MTPAIALTDNADVSSYAGDLAGRLMAGLRIGTGSTQTERADLLQQFLAYAAAAEQRIAEQRQRIAELESLSTTDELTGLLNRRGFELYLRQVLSAAGRHGEGGLLAYIDVDNFKAINDAHGHAGGDAVLRWIAGILSRSVRTSDCVARLHGDEFAVLLVRASPEHSATRIRRIQRAINATPVLNMGKPIGVSASIGVTAFGPNCDLEDVMHRADAAMYENKRRTRGD